MSLEGGKGSMNQEIKKLWLEELESGRRRCGVGSLYRMDGSQCCLGVLSDLYIQETGIGEWVGDNEAYHFTLDNLSTTCYLAPAVQDWAELTDYEIPPLITYNDGQRAYPIELIKAL